jgi:hypothetical protein
MKDEQLLERIRDHVRAERADDAALEALARGDEGDAAATDLLRRAESDPEVAAMIEASRPLGDELEAKIAGRIARPAKEENEQENKEQKTSRVVAFRRRAAIVAGPLALAAALVLYVTVGTGPSGPELPSYAVSATGQAAMRGPADAPTDRLRLPAAAGADGARFEIVARPATSVAPGAPGAPGVPVVAYVFAIGDGEDPSAVDAKVEIAPEGAVRITGTHRALQGARELRVVVAQRGAIAKFDDALARAKEKRSDSRVRVLTVPIDQ